MHAIVSNDNEARKHAEAAIASIQDRDTSGLVSGLATVLKCSSDASVQQLAGVLLRQQLRKEGVWTALTVEARNVILETVSGIVLAPPTSRGVYLKVSGVLGALAILASNEVFLILEQLAGSTEPLHREAMLSAINVLAEFRNEEVSSRIANIKAIIIAGLQDTNGDVRVSAMQATVSILLSMDKSNVGGMVDTIPLMFGNVLGGEGLDEVMMRDAISSLVQLASQRANFFKAYLDDVVAMMLKFAGDKTCDVQTRRFAFEFLCVMSENGRAMMRHSKQFASSAIGLAFEFLLDYDWDVDWEDEANDAESETFLYGVDGLERFAASLGPKTFIPIGTSLCMQYVQNKDDPNHRFAGLSALGAMSAVLVKGLPAEHLSGIVNIVLKHFEESDERVRFAACNTLSQFCNAFGETIRSQMLEVVVAKLIGVITSSQSSRVSSEACMCITYFFQEVADEAKPVLEKFVQPLLNLMMTLIKSNRPSLQGAAVNTLASIASVCGHHFIAFYDHFVPMLLSILTQCTADEQKMLRSRAVEAIAFIGAAVGPERFGADAISLLDLLVPIVASGTGDEYIDYSYLHPAFARIAQTIGDAFAPYLDVVIPKLLQSSQIENGFVVDESDGPAAQQEETDGVMVVNVAIRGVGDRRVCINTTILQEKAVACNMLFQYASDLQSGFFRYVQPTASSLVPLLKYAYNDDVRCACVATMPKLMEAAAPGGPQFVSELFCFIFPNMIEAMDVEPDLYALTDIVIAFGDLLRAYIELDGKLSTDQLDSANKLVSAILVESLDRQHQRQALVAAGNLEEEELDEIAEHNEEESELTGNLVDWVQQMAKACREAYLPSFQAHLSQVAGKMIVEPNYALTRVSAMCMFEEVMLMCGPEAAEYAPHFLPLAIAYCRDADVNVRQSACYGVGIVSQVAPKVFEPHSNGIHILNYS